MTIRKAFAESTYGMKLVGTMRPQPLVWQWWLRVEAAYKRMCPGEELLEPPSETCMLPQGHDGPHKFTPDDQIGVALAPVDSEKDPACGG